MTEINSRYYGLSPLRKYGIRTHIIQSDITIKENRETIVQLGANMKISFRIFFLVRGATLETLRNCILFHMFRDCVDINQATREGKIYERR